MDNYDSIKECENILHVLLQIGTFAFKTKWTSIIVAPINWSVILIHVIFYEELLVTHAVPLILHWTGVIAHACYYIYLNPALRHIQKMEEVLSHVSIVNEEYNGNIKFFNRFFICGTISALLNGVLALAILFISDDNIMEQHLFIWFLRNYCMIHSKFLETIYFISCAFLTIWMAGLLTYIVKMVGLMILTEIKAVDYLTSIGKFSEANTDMKQIYENLIIIYRFYVSIRSKYNMQKKDFDTVFRFYIPVFVVPFIVSFLASTIYNRENTKYLYLSIFFAVMLLPGLLCYCFVLQSMHEWNENICSTLEDLSWYHWDKKTKQVYLMFLIIVQPTMKFYMSKSQPLDLQSPLRVCKSAFSAAMVLANLKK